MSAGGARIGSVRAIPFALPFKEPYVTAKGRLEARRLILVEIQTNDGLSGYGETGPMSLRGGAGADEIAESIESGCARVIAGESPTAGEIPRIVDRLLRAGVGPQALAGVDIALWDLAGKQAEVPVWKLLGGDSPPRLRCNATLSVGSPDDVARQAEIWKTRGFVDFKLKVGWGGDREQVRAVREVVGPDARIRVDANGSWTVEEAVSILDDLADELELCEQPCKTIDEMAKVARLTSVPVVADESVTSPADGRRAASAGASIGATVKLIKVGGIEMTRRLARAIPVSYMSSALDGPIGIAAALHAVAGLPAEDRRGRMAHGLATELLFADDSVSRPTAREWPFQTAPDAPGIGVGIDTRFASADGRSISVR